MSKSYPTIYVRLRNETVWHVRVASGTTRCKREYHSDHDPDFRVGMLVMAEIEHICPLCQAGPKHPLETWLEDEPVKAMYQDEGGEG